ncbi:amidohydrolase family protein [Agarivorans sp. Alg241-V36]|uniref:metal-dependent hydrolase family protein n=1 Tax=Agarivorans sp. Alg241-V36 TaxID=2305992 RepID=UPI0013D61D4F|nr:amidohydrolase family protein [Agarivorans sp. Alg241-V36]
MIKKKLLMLGNIMVMSLAVVIVFWSPSGVASENSILITNVKIFNGKSGDLIENHGVLIENNQIVKLVPDSEEADYKVVIDGKNGYLTPGLIDVHSHAVMGADQGDFFNGDPNYIQLFAAKEMDEMLMRGVTTIRDAGGNAFALKKAIDNGVVKGPRIYPSGAVISQYSGHADFRPSNPSRLPKEWGGPLAPGEAEGHVLIANGKDQVIAAVRQQLFLGATQIKLAVGGGVSSFTDPLYVNEYSDEEIKAAVEAAADYGTYIQVHVFNDIGTQRAIEAGAKTIEHGHLLSEETLKLMAKKDVFLSTQVQVLAQLKPLYTDPIRKWKLEQALKGMDNMFKMAKKHNVKVAFGTDLLFSYEGRKKQLHDLTLRKEWYDSSEIMIQATGNGGEVVGLTGLRNPYGKLGVIEEGAMADLLIYKVNPLEDVSIVEDYENNLQLIIKDGQIYKNTL